MTRAPRVSRAMDRSAAAATGATLAELAALSGATVDGDPSLRVTRVATLAAAGPGDIAFLSNPKYRDQLASTRASAVIVAPDAAASTALPKLVSADPYATYAHVAARLHPTPAPRAGHRPVGGGRAQTPRSRPAPRSGRAR